jgi:hypothetical protein
MQTFVKIDAYAVELAPSVSEHYFNVKLTLELSVQAVKRYYLTA